MLNPNLKTVFHKIISLTRFEGGHAESAIIHSGLQNTQQAGGKCCFGLGPAPENVGLNFYENLKIVKKIMKS